MSLAEWHMGAAVTGGNHGYFAKPGGARIAVNRKPVLVTALVLALIAVYFRVNNVRTNKLWFGGVAAAGIILARGGFSAQQ